MLALTKLPKYLQLVVLLLLVATAGFGQGGNGGSEISGTLSLKFNRCFIPSHDHHEDTTFCVQDDRTFKVKELDVSKLDKSKLIPGSKVKIKGFFKNHPTPARGRIFEASSITVASSATESDTTSSSSPTSFTADPEVANAPPSMTNLNCLLIFANSNDFTINESKVTVVEDMLFDADGNNGKSAKLAMEAMTNGHFTLSHGATARVTLSINTSGQEADYIETKMYDAAVAAGYTMSNYQRLLFFSPNGTVRTGNGGSGWTAYGYSGGNPARTMYSYSWTGTFFDAFLHELGHNFGLNHAGIPPNDSWDDQYKDETCVMGWSHSNTASPRYTATYSGAKKYQKGWLNNWGSQIALTQDATYDLYPISISPEITAGMRVVQVDDPADTTEFHISYRRSNAPYGWLNKSGDADKVYVQEQAGHWSTSWRKATLTSGSYTAGNAQVIFERYGPNNEYATVSFDFPDGNTKPVANSQSVSTEMNTPLDITLTGSDADGNNLQYSIVQEPANGSVAPLTGQNVTYTPNSSYVGADSFVFKVDDGNICSFATISITVTESNVPPVADNQSVDVFYETPELVTLTASDANPLDTLSYSIVSGSGPANGTLSSVSGQTVTYTPNLGFSGTDSFRFRAYDGKAYSNEATVTLNVSTLPNYPPTVEAGETKVVTLATGGAWTPESVSPILWFDASDTSTIVSSSGVVSQWNDKSTNGINLSQTNSGLRPSTGATINGLNAIDFTGDKMSSSSNPFGANIDDAYLILVHKVDQIANGTVFSLSGTTTTAQRWQSHAPWGDGNIYFDANGRTSGSYSVSAGDVVLSGFYNSVTDSSRIIYKNGAVLASTGSASQVVTAGAIWLGGISSSYQDTTIGEVLVINGTVTTEDRQKMEGYLAHKWGLATNLPADHPHKDMAPGVTGVSVPLADAIVTDPEHTPTLTWTVVGGNPLAVSFDDNTIQNPTATFTESGIYTLQLTADDGYDQRSDTVTIIVNDGPEVLISETGGSTDLSEEGATDTYSITLATEPTADVTITLTPDSDVTVTPGSVTFTAADWNIPQDVTVTAVDDAIDEGTHTGTITHSATSSDANYDGITIPDVVGTITDNDDPGTIALKSATYTVGESDGIVTITVSRTGGDAGAASVTLDTSNGSATAGADYVTKNVTINWGDRESGDKTVDVTISGDVDPESDETFDVTLSNAVTATLGSPSTATVTITDDDDPGTLALESATYGVDENGVSVTLTVTRTGGSAGTVSVDYGTSDGSAVAGTDYTATSGTLTWNVGDTESKSFSVMIMDDGTPETSEDFTVALSNVSVANLGSPSTTTVTITDDDFSPSTIAGLVGWYDAQLLNVGTSVANWSDLTDASVNTVANDLVPVSGTTQPTVQTVSLNGGSFKVVRFVQGTNNQVELLKAASLMADGDTSRTVIVAYKGGVDNAASRVASFGAVNDGANANQAKVWGLATDGNGSMRFEGNQGGRSITGYAAGLNRTNFVIRTAVMNSASSFNEYIDVLDDAYTDTQVLTAGNPGGISSTHGTFYLGDSAASSDGGAAGAADFDVLEVLVYDKVLSTTERQNVQNYLKDKYVPKPKMSVLGQGFVITDGDVTPDTLDDTAFGSVNTAVTHTFTISNTGTAALNLDGTPDTVQIITVGTDFTISSQPATTSVAADGSVTFDVTFTPSGLSGVQTADISIINSDSTTGGDYTFRVSATGDTGSPVTVDNAYIFYNNSAWDDNNPAATPADDAAIAMDKTPLLPGFEATFGNYTSYDKGINGIMIDVANLADTNLDETDFTFKVGNDNDPSNWPEVIATPSVTVRTGEGVGGSDRITIIWTDGAISKEWLEITVKAAGRVGLTSDTVFYYGNAIGEVGNSSSDALVNASDALGMRANPASIGTAAIDNQYDCNRDKAVNATDVLKARSNATTTSTALQLITP